MIPMCMTRNGLVQRLCPSSQRVEPPQSQESPIVVGVGINGFTRFFRTRSRTVSTACQAATKAQ
jgi:hypothetical protein